MFERSQLVGAEYFERIGVSDRTTPMAIQAKLQAQSVYSVLGLTVDAELKDIKAAYRTLIHQFYPGRYLAAQRELGHHYNEAAITNIANSVAHAITTAYIKLLTSAQAATSADAPTHASIQGEIDLTLLLFPARPPRVDKESARRFIGKMDGEISSVIQACQDEEAYHAIQELMQNLQEAIKSHEDLLLPDLASVPADSRGSAASSSSSQLLSREGYKHGVLHTQFHVFLLECLDDVEVARQALPEQRLDEPVASPCSRCQVVLAFLKFLLNKMIKLCSCDGTPIYQEGLYNGLFPAPKPNVNARVDAALEKITENLVSERGNALYVSKEMTGDQNCLSSAAWNDHP